MSGTTLGTSIRLGHGLTFMALGLLAAVLLLWCPGHVSGGLADAEPPLQYSDWDSAYNMTFSEMGTAFDVRKDGGGDADFIKMSFITLGDIYYIDLDNHGDPATTVDVWVHDPGRFPIAYHHYDGSGERNATLRFCANRAGPYYLQFGQGFGATVISVNITGYTNGHIGDGNDMPQQAGTVLTTVTVDGTFGQPVDPHDFYQLVLAPSDEVKVFLSFSLAGNASVVAAQWEIYNSTGILRESMSYSSDCISMGAGTETFDERMTGTDTYYLRVWCIGGSGDYSLRIDIRNHTNDGNDGMAGATPVEDGDVVNGTLHTRFDPTDWYKVHATGADHIQLWLDVDDDADMFLYDGLGSQLGISDNWGTESEYISFSVHPSGTGYYYVLVTLSTEEDPIPYRTIGYGLRVVTNLPPEIVRTWADTYRSWPIDEDEVDEGILLSNLFIDPEGGHLWFSVEPVDNDHPIRASVQGSRLRLEPGDNVSGVVLEITVKARDGSWQWAAFNITVAIINVNDAPVVGHPTAGPPPEQLEVDEDSFSGPFDVLFWFWDVDDPASELTILLDPGPEVRADLDDMDRLLLQTLVQDWNGMTNLSVTARDPEGLTATIMMPVEVVPVNDAPHVAGPDLTLVVNDRVTATVDLADSFADIEGDPLTYSADSTSTAGLALDGAVLAVDGLLDHQQGTVLIAVTATDPAGATSDPLMVTLEVGEIPQPHGVRSPVEEYGVLEGTSISFVDIVVVDPDPRPSHYEVMLTVGDVVLWCHLMDTPERLYWTGGEPVWTPEDLGRDRDVVVTLHLIDEWYNASISWVVHVRLENEPPSDLAIVPDRPGPYPPSEGVTLTGHATDADEDYLTLRWELDGVEVARGRTLRLDNLTVGHHEVVLWVSDGFVEVSTGTRITVREGTGPEGDGAGRLGALGVLVAMLVVVGLWFALRSVRRTVR